MAKTRLTKDEIKQRHEHAFLLYTEQKITDQRELSKRVGISETTISKWVNDGNWKKYALNIPLTRSEQMQNLLAELTEMNNFIKAYPEGQRFADSKMADARRKLIKDIKDLETKALPAEIIAAMRLFIEFVRPENLEEARVITKWADMFIKGLFK